MYSQMMKPINIYVLLYIQLKQTDPSNLLLI